MNRKLAWQLCRLIVVWTLVLLMSLDTAFACRVLARWRAYRTCYVPCQVCCHHRETTCGGVPAEKTEPTCHGSDSPAEPTVNSSENAATAEPTAPAGTDTAELPESEPIPVDEPPASDSPSEITESADPAPVEQEPIEENDDASLADEVESTEPEVPVEEVAEETDPADEPAEEATVTEEPPAEEEPVEQTPAEENDDVDDLFGDVEAAKEQTPVEEQPAEENDDVDDLFGDVEATEEQTPAEENDVVDDLFGGVEATEEQTPAEENDVVDDLFRDVEEAEEQTPTEEQPAETTDDKDQKAEDDLDDIFGQRHSINKLKTTVASLDTDNPLKIRRWVDNTGLYSTVGGLVLVMPEAVRILKGNGRYTTVAKKRLSSADLDYVDQMDHQHGSNLRGRWAMAR